jgi:hypothetical protein
VRWLSGDHQSRTTVRDALVAVARDSVAAGPRLRLLDPADLDVVLRHGTEQRLGSSLVVSLRSASLPVPAWLETHRFESASRRANIMNGLSHIAPALSEAEIPWVVLKGPVISSSFDSFEQREFADLDILVPGNRLGDVLDVFYNVGIDAQNHNWDAYQRYGVAEFPIFVAGTPIDLHWQVIGLAAIRRRFTVDVGDMLKRRYRTSIGEIELYRLDTEDHALHVALHAGLSGGHHIGLLRDVHETVRASNPDWEQLVARCHRFGVAPMVGQVLDRCRHVLGTPVPSEIPEELAPLPALSLRRRLDARVRRRGLTPETAHSGFIIGASRSGVVNSVQRAAEMLSERATIRFGHSPQWDASDPEGALYWNRHSGGAEGMAGYLAFAEQES